MNRLSDFLTLRFYIYRALLLMVLLITAHLFVRERGAKQKLLALLRQPCKVAFFFYAAFILTATLFARPTTNPCMNVLRDFSPFVGGRFNFEPFNNLFLFIPYTLFFLLAFRPGKPFRAAFALSAVTTLFIELSQLLFWLGEFQFSDILYNVVGGMIGCGLGLLVMKHGCILKKR